MRSRAVDPIKANLQLILDLFLSEKVLTKEIQDKLETDLLAWGAQIARAYIHAVDFKGQPMITDEEIDLRFGMKEENP